MKRTSWCVKWKGGFLLSLLIFCFLGGAVTEASSFSISVRPNLKDDQQGDGLSGFNLKMSPGETATYEVSVKNSGTEDKEIFVRIHNGGTLAAGQIDLTNPKAKMSQKSQMALTDIVTLMKDRYKVPKSSEIKVPFTINVPKKGIKGILLGSIYILDENKDTQRSSSEGLAVHNQVGYPTEIIVATGTEQFEAALSLGEPKVGVSAGHPALTLPIENENPHIVPDLTVATEVKSRKGNSVLVNHVQKKNQLAPFAIFDHELVLSEGEVKSGDYVAKVVATSAYGDWQWEKPFTISSTVAKDINQRSIQKKPPYLLYGLLAGLAVLVLVVGYLSYRLIKIKKATLGGD